MKIITPNKKEQAFYRFHRSMLLLVAALLLLLVSPCKAILFRRSNSKNPIFKERNISQPPQKDLNTEDESPEISPIFPKPPECLTKRSFESKYSRGGNSVGNYTEANRFSEYKKVTSIGEEFARKISEELKPSKIQSKLENDLIELLFSELIRGLLDCNFMVALMPTLALVRGFLVDLSMSMWVAIRNHHEYKQRSNWQCDDDACELIDASIPTQMESVSVGTSDCQSQLLSIAKNCATSLLIHLLSHQVVPYVLHSIEDCMGQLAVAVS